MYYRKIIKLGGSLYVGIPANLCNELGLLRGDTAQIRMDSGAIMIQRDIGPAKIRSAMSTSEAVKKGKDNG